METITTSKKPNTNWGKKTDIKGLERVMSNSKISLTTREVDVLSGKIAVATETVSEPKEQDGQDKGKENTHRY